MSNRKIDSWARKVADVFKSECPEIVAVIVENEDYVFPFFPPTKRGTFAHGILPAKRAQEIEQASIDVLNKYYTGEVRQKLKAK
jgi:hypothetical protein